jgi:peptidoglycan/LPS O-acetylase OafA/YrhL
MTLSSLSQGRDNNFNLIRIFAALAVLASHCYPLSGIGKPEPLVNLLGISIAHIAVDIFFITSGFLVTSSLLNRQNIIVFFWARFLRIYPALLIMLSITVFVLGPFFTSFSLSSYLQNRGTYTYFAYCSSLIYGVAFELPGVFSTNPFHGSVNGSLWTMPFEVRMYGLLAIAWIIFNINRKYKVRFLKVSICTYVILSATYIITNHLYGSYEESKFVRLSFMFFTGSIFYLLKEYIHLSFSFFMIIITSLLVATYDKDIFYIGYCLSIAYILFFIAYIPSGHIRKYNLLGDYSYGIYIYAFPVQQSTAALIPGVSPFFMALIATPITILFSVLSWHIIEKRALGLKEHFAGFTKKILDFR